MFKKITYAIHRVLGTVISLLFLMWFITGLVLIYKSFPDVDKTQRHDHRICLTDSLPNIEDVLAQIPQDEKLKSIQVNQYKNKGIFTVETSKDTYYISSQLEQDNEPISKAELEDIAQSWVQASIAKIDTLHKQDIWIMYSKYQKELPIYKVHFDDSAKHQLYLSSRTGEVQQLTTRNERLWAYVGSIPHKLYIPALRQHTRTWINTLTTLATLSFITVITGFILGVRAYTKRYKIQKKWSTPYRKFSYKWHTLFGFAFSLFLFTWSISGMMALQKVPQWLVKTHTNYHIPQKIKGKKVDPAAYPLDYRKLQEAFPKLKQISWTSFQGVPIYEIIDGKEVLHIDASKDSIQRLNLSEAQICQAIESIHGQETKYNIQLIHHFEEYYLPWKRDLDLPVYKVSVESEDENTYYISPETGNYKHLDKNRKARKWLFNGFHYLHIQWLMERPVLWTLTIWFLALGCIAVSGTGVWLSFKFLIRKLKKKPKKTC